MNSEQNSLFDAKGIWIAAYEELKSEESSTKALMFQYEMLLRSKLPTLVLPGNGESSSKILLAENSHLPLNRPKV